jgi:amino acid permease (GABA permease)
MAQTRTDRPVSKRRTPPVVLDDDETLRELGYPRQLSRRLTVFGNFAISTTVINFMAGIMSALAIGMSGGGPRVMIWGWVFVGLMVLFVGASMAEITSAFPTSGALYYWSAKLAKRNNARWSWYTGWLNSIGQVGGTAATDFAAATFIQALVTLQWSSYTPTARKTLLIYAAIIVLHASINTFTVGLVALFNRISVLWLIVGGVAIIGWLAVFPTHHQSTSFVFTHFVNGTGFHSGLYAGLIGLLLTSWTFTGFDGSAHMAEETTQAAVSAPRGIVRAIAFSWVAGFFLLLAMIYSMTDYPKEASASPPPAQIFIDALGLPTAKILLLVVIGALLFCGLANLTSNSRQIFAFSRDGAIPGSRWWRSVSRRTHTPVKSVWFAAFWAFILGVPSLWSSTAFGAIVSINVIGLFGAYAIPIFLRMRQGADFVPGPWSLGRWGRPAARVAVTWVVLSSILFLLPQASPITRDNFNYAPIALSVVLIIATVWWVVTARRTFHGPVRYGTPEELARMEQDMA